MLFGGVFDVDAAGLRQVHEHAADGAEVEHEVLPGAADRLDGGADERVGRGHDRLQRREPERIGPLEHAPGEHVGEPLGERLHLRKLGHASAPFDDP